MSSTRIMRGKLINRDGNRCHYCNECLNRPDSTIDHVIPRSMGGISHPDNYVLACRDCNELRGNDLRWCDCSWCGPLLEDFKRSAQYFNYLAYKLFKFNHPVVRYRKKHWIVYLHNNQHMFSQWQHAIDFALIYGKEPSHGAQL